VKKPRVPSCLLVACKATASLDGCTTMMPRTDPSAPPTSLLRIACSAAYFWRVTIRGWCVGAAVLWAAASAGPHGVSRAGKISTLPAAPHRAPQATESPRQILSMVSRRVLDEPDRPRLLGMVYQRDWEGVRSACKMLGRPPSVRQDPFLVWIDQLSASHLGKEPLFVDHAGQPIISPDLLGEQLDREVYNRLVELEWLIDSSSWNEAAGRIADTLSLEVAGLAPSSAEPSLRWSWHAAVHAQLAEHPGLREQLDEQHGDLIQLHFQRAIRGRQLDEVTELAERLKGVSAAANAQTWLGDQHLAGGRATQALQWYRKAVGGNLNDATADLQARLALAAALAGRPLDVPLDAPAHFGEVTLAARETEQLVKQLRARRTARDHEQSARGLWERGCQLRPGPRIALQQALGQDPAQQVLVGVDRQRVDWPGRQLAAVRSDDLLLVHNRFELSALDWATGETLWTSHPMSDQTMRSRDWPLVPMRPLVFGRRVFARHLSSEAPQVVCWNRTGGQHQWTADLGDQIPISDPLVVDHRLAVMTLSGGREIEAPLHLQFLEAETGQVSDSHRLLRLRRAWWERSCCQLASSNRQIYGVLGGVTFCCDTSGQLRWVRSSQTVPTAADETSITQFHQPPLVRESTLFAAQVGVRAVEAIDRVTGRLSWRTVMADIQRIVGISADQLIVQLDSGLKALDVHTGKVQWHVPVDQRLLTTWLAADSVICAQAADTEQNGARRSMRLVCLDARTGSEQGTVALDSIYGSALHAGPIVVHEDRAWLFFGVGTLAGPREMIELVARKDEAP